MEHEVLARKWRPRQFADLVGQDHVTRTLRNALETRRFAHAYLFVGPRGIGKTSVARILAKALNCVNGPTAKPCDACASCIEIAAGRSLDVVEIDGASNTGVDNVRDLREKIQFSPARDRFKVYIVDEVHMLSTGAFNALLKTLEEPPAHVKFIFATTEPEKLLPTIVSRCQRFDLRRIPTALIAGQLRIIADKEGIAATDAALQAVARAAEGGLRDAESALDQLASFCQGEIAEDDVLSVFGLVSGSQLRQVAHAVLSGDYPRVFEALASLDSGGKDMRRALTELMSHFRNVLVVLHAQNPEPLLDVDDATLELCREHARMTDTDRLLRIQKILAEADDRLRFSLSRRALLEMALVRAARAATAISLDEALGALEALPDGAAVGIGRMGGSAAGGSAVRAFTGDPPAGPEPRPSPPVPALDTEAAVAKLRGEWETLRASIVERAPGMATALSDARIVGIEGGSIVLGIDSEFAVELTVASARVNLAAMREVFARALGVSMPVRIVGVDLTPTGAPEVASEGHNRVSGAGTAESADETPIGESSLALERDPAVARVVERFTGRLLGIRV